MTTATRLRGNDGALGQGEGDNVLDDIEQVFGSAFADVLDAGAASRALFGRAGDDRLFGGPAGDALRGDDGNDTLDGREALDDLEGGRGNDTLLPGPGPTISTSDGDDIQGGDGFDTVDYSSRGQSVNVTVDNVKNDGSSFVYFICLLYLDNGLFGRICLQPVPFPVFENDNVFTDVEAVRGGTAASSITGSAGPNSFEGLGGGDVLDGKGGNDELFGGDGGDKLTGGPGADSLNGGADNDVCDVDPADIKVVSCNERPPIIKGG